MSRRLPPSAKNRAHSFTLVEVVIAITLFGMLSVAGMVVWQDILKTYKKIQMEEYLYTETTALLERISRTVQESGIDYEEYYNVEVIGNAIGITNLGENYGEYHKQFFVPFDSNWPSDVNPTAGPEPNWDGTPFVYGAWCLDTSEYDNGCNTGVMADTATFDFNTGQHPYAGSGLNPEEANAMCEDDSSCTTTLDYHASQQLFLINPSGTERTYFVLEGGNVSAVSMVELNGTDSDSDGLIDIWECDERFTGCTGSGNLPTLADLSDGVLDNNDFFPISSRHLFIDELIFYVSPIEDPFKGYQETDTTTVFENVQMHPRVTIRITAHFQMYDNAGNPVDFEDYAGLVGEAPTLALETTVSTGNTEEIPAYSFP